MAAFRPLSPCILHPNFDFFDPDPEEDKPNSSSTPASTDVTVNERKGRVDLGEFATDHDILIQANSFLDKYTKNYQRVMNGLLPSTGHSLDSSELTEQHEVTFQKLQKLLESDLKVVVQHFTSVFKTRTEAEFEGLLKLNTERVQEEVKARRKAKREWDKEMSKLDAEEQVRIIQEELSKRTVERKQRLDQQTENIQIAVPKAQISDSKFVRRREDEDRLKVQLQNEAKKQEAVEAIEEKNKWKQEKMRAEKVRIEIKCLLNEHRTMYNRAMDELLPTSGPSRIEKELEKQHNENLIKICKSLEIKVTEMEVKIPHEEHVSTLKGNIEQDWVELQKLNSRLKQKDINDSIRRREEDRLKVELQNEAKKQEAVKVLEESNNRKQEKMTEQTETIVASFPPPSSSNPSPAKQCSPAIEKELPELFPIAIEFGFTLVRLGWMVEGQFELINNNWGEETTPTFIAVKEDGEIKIGVEANDEIEKVSLQDFFTEKNTCGTCYVDRSIQNVRPEILVALFLARLKSDVEGQKKGRWTTTVITVPLCFTSVQRQSMKDAAYLAGFESIKLINDTTAAAFCFTKTCHFNPEKKLLVGVAQDHTSYFDAALYGWRQCGTTGLELISYASCGNLHASFQVNGGLIKGLKSFVNRFDRLWNSIEVNQVREMVKGLIGENMIATAANVCVNYKCDDAFDNIINRYGRAVPPNDAKYYIIKGAAIFSRNSIPTCESKKVSIKDRASYSFLRTSHSSTASRTPMSVIYEYQMLLAPNTPSEPTITTIGSLNGRDMQITIYEKSHDKLHHVGYLVVKTSCADNTRQYREVRVKFTLSEEGIFEVEKGYLASDVGTSSKQDIPFEWMSPKILRSQLDKFRAQVASMVKDEKKEAFETSKKELRTLIEEIKPKIDGVKSTIRKQILEEGIESANVMLSHKNTTQEQLEKKITFLQGLQSKYGLH